MSLASLNLSSASNKGRTMTVLHPEERTPLKTADGTVLTITLLGRDSDAFIRAERAAKSKAFEQVTKKGKFNPAESDQQTAETLAACTTAWSGIPVAWLTEGGEDESPAEFSRANAVALYTNPGLRWLKEQVDEFVGDRANFLQA